ncbi:MAG: D-glycero-beta-D-manno-heptose 1-phosphate adenylyltransferase [Candidatus Omnitrophica bacterium]|nr:D-glycero-beta-D-manno-heptose 1-phosphate adenylyltransferase [Candidatus Omnitrophota bacterium]
MSRRKIKTTSQIKKIASGLHRQGKKIVFTNGCFDLIHFGHVMYLEKARSKGDILILGLNSDSSVKRIKGNKRPIVSQDDRAGVLEALESVDYVVIFNEDTPLETIKAIKPDALVKGSDWKKNNIVGAEFVRSYGGKIYTITLASGRSTTNLINKIVKTFKN